MASLNKRPDGRLAISDAEWEIMNVLWNEAPIRACEILDRLGPEKNWKRKTINTFLSRLAAKGIVKIRKEENVNVYRPALTRDRCVKSEATSFLKRVFRGATTPMIIHFLENEKLSKEEIGELRRTLDDLEK